MNTFKLVCGVFVLVLGPVAALAHNVPGPLAEPRSVPEAWNVIEESAANVDQLLDGALLREVVYQVANISQPLILLRAKADGDRRAETIRQAADRLVSLGFEVVAASRTKSNAMVETRRAWQTYRATLKELEAEYPPEVVHARVYICPMHPNDRHLDAGKKCTVCGMAVVRRHLPVSAVYEKPGTATLKLKVLAPPLVVGQRAEVRIQISTAAGAPVGRDDLLEIHTQKIHLLINDQTLGDYHHEHPRPTEMAGEYVFSFTPARPGPYRIWADVVPAATGVQEYVIADIPAKTQPAPRPDRQAVLSTRVNGRMYDLQLNDGHPVRSGETVIGTIAVSGADGKPFTELEPLMGAFAHIVGFAEDGKTVLHIHPYGREPMDARERGGPAFAFKFYAPSPGFWRLYVQVQVNGASEFAAFGIPVPAQPAEEKSSK